MVKRKVFISKKAEFANDNMLHGENYAFYHRPNYPALPPKWYVNLIESATRSVDIWDPYFNCDDKDATSDCRVFNYLRNYLKLRYLMVKEKPVFDEKIKVWEPEIANAIPKAVKAGMEVTFAYISKHDDFGLMWEFHDRYLIIDGERVFLIGGSLGYHLAPIASTGMYELKEEADKNLVIEKFNEYWAFAKKRNHYKELAL